MTWASYSAVLMRVQMRFASKAREQACSICLLQRNGLTRAASQKMEQHKEGCRCLPTHDCTWGNENPRTPRSRIVLWPRPQQVACKIERKRLRPRFRHRSTTREGRASTGSVCATSWHPLDTRLGVWAIYLSKHLGCAEMIRVLRAVSSWDDATNATRKGTEAGSGS